MNLISFGSDNHSGVHPLLLEEMIRVNEGFAPSYEQDPWSQELRKHVLSSFSALDCALVFNGTAANVLSLQIALESYQAVLCAETSHMNLDECGAPEKIAGVKLIPASTIDGKIAIDGIENYLTRNGDQHHSQIKMISVTQPTEYGTVYTLAELKKIRAICDQHQLYLHIDGARLANAAVHLSCTLADLCEFADVVSLGGAKNGLMLGELIVVRNPTLKDGLKFFRKQSLQLPSKTRFLTAPFTKYLQNNLWREIALHENAMAQYLRQQLEALPGIEFTHTTQANSVFCLLPKSIIKELRKSYFFYVWNEKTFEVRLMTSFSTQKEHIDGFCQELARLTKAMKGLPL